MRPLNRYGWSKLGGECLLHASPLRYCILRCPFGPDEFPYDKAFEDQVASRQGATVAAEKVLTVLEHYLLLSFLETNKDADEKENDAVADFF